jgi:hypothetical protein
MKCYITSFYTFRSTWVEGAKWDLTKVIFIVYFVISTLKSVFYLVLNKLLNFKLEIKK